MDVHETLVAAFRCLTKTQKKRLAYHLEMRTPVCCGRYYGLYAKGKAG